MSRTRLIVLLALALLAACGDGPSRAGRDASGPDLLVRVALAATTLHPGEGVALTVTRVWPEDLEPAPWDEAVLAPLILREPRVERREYAGRIEETRTYRAYAFSLKDVRVPSIMFAVRGKASGAVRLARSEPVELTIQPVLDPTAPGPPEGPGASPRAPGIGGWLVGLLLLVLAFEGTAWRARRTRVLAARQRLRAPLRRLRALEHVGTETPAARRAALLEAIDAVREHITLAQGVAAQARTTQEIQALLTGAPAAAWETLAASARVDAVKFGGASVTPDGLQVALAQAIGFVGGERSEGAA